MTTSEILQRQREYFLSGATRDINFRIKNLKLLKATIVANEEKILAALREDLNKLEIEGYMCEVGLTLSEIDYCLRHLKKWARPTRVKTGIANFPAKSYMQPVPKGCVLIMSPWNYPFLLTIEPLVDALAAGNTAIVKPSAYSPATSRLILDLLSNTFKSEYVSVLTGGREVNQDLLSLKFDHIFFTGSKAVGHEVLRRAEPNMTPVTLELGGKSPCIVDETAPIALAAKRIIFGKLLNVGQTCIAPDYILVHENVKDLLVRQLAYEIKLQYCENILENKDYGKIISQKHFDRARALLEGQNIAVGGGCDEKSLKIEPTIVLDPKLTDPIMTNEIFAPILPVISFKTREEAASIIRLNDTPLALYIFSKDKKAQEYFTKNIAFGGGCINDTIMHIASSRMAFGGFGESGIGAYHGKRGFDTFSHYKSILKKSLKIDLPLRYRPMTKFKEKTIKKFM